MKKNPVGRPKGVKMGKPPTHTVGIRMPTDMFEKIKADAAREDRSISKYICLKLAGSQIPPAKSAATEFMTEAVDARPDEIMTALDASGIPSDQDWENEKTTWTFDDGSQIIVCGSEIEIK